jgi:hypothetical protein
MTHLLFCDETDVVRAKGGNFFLYGGLVIAPDQYADACAVVTEARADLGLLPSEPLKFSPKSRPSRIDTAAWTAAKDKVLRGAGGLGLQFLGVYVHESIAKTDSKVHFAVDALCVAFDQVLAAAKGHGFVVIDHTHDVDRADFAEIASGAVAVSIFKSDLKAIGGVAFGHVESALPLQITDVVLGALRYCMEKPHHDVSVDIYRALGGLTGKLEQRPWNVKVPHYASDYARLRADLSDLGARAKQEQQG